MSRRAHVIRRAEVMPDSKYQSLTVSKLMNRIMKRGKKSRAEEIVYGAMELMGICY
jgi:small subunit ribosomal protein S7